MNKRAVQEQAMTAKDIMSNSPLWCEAKEDAYAVANTMKLGNVGILPVLQDADTRRVVGVVTDRDLCLRVIGAGLDPRFTSVSECMTREAVCCEANDSVNRVLTLMAGSRVRRLPVIDDAERLLGIVSIDDIVRRNAAPAERVCVALKDIYRCTRATVPRARMAAAR